MDKWKVFNRDTEAGRLLSKLYGVADAGKVSYPQPRRRRSTAAAIDTTVEDEGGAASSTRSWKTTCVVHGMDKKAEEEKERERKGNTERALGLAVPKVGRHTTEDGASPQGRKIDLVPRRKTEAVCRDIVEEAANKKRMYRPPRSRDVSSDEEKARLQRMMAGDSPSPPSALKSGGAISDAILPENLCDQLISEMNERSRHQLAMEAIGAGDDARERTAYEIKERLEHLRRLDPQRALVEAQKLLEA
jgi:hypothetical protein